jgi:hypothetical protein
LNALRHGWRTLWSAVTRHRFPQATCRRQTVGWLMGEARLTAGVSEAGSLTIESSVASTGDKSPKESVEQSPHPEKPPRRRKLSGGNTATKPDESRFNVC